MCPLPTKERILKEALTLFAEKGYESVRVAEIADAVGIKASSLYKHYKNKQAIFDAIVEHMAQRYEKQAASMQMNGLEAEKDITLFSTVSTAQLTVMSKGLFQYFLHDEYAYKFRRMLSIEQYHSASLAALYVKQYMDDPISYQGTLFGLLVQNGILIQENPDMIALHFFAPIFLLLHMCDCQPEREAEALLMVEEHICLFQRLYQQKGWAADEKGGVAK